MTTWKRWRDDANIRRIYYIREELIFLIRKFFRINKFHEVETPILVPCLIPESYYEYFNTDLLDRNLKKKTMFLSASPEASLKKLLTAGVGNCFEISKCFRNTEIGSNFHNPEFTLLEWYMVDADYKNSMDFTEKLFHFLFINLSNKNLIKKEALNIFQYQNFRIDISKWEKISVSQALKKFSGIEFDSIVNRQGKNDQGIFSAEKIKPVARKKGYAVEEENSWEEIFNQIYLNEIEPNLGREHPTIIYDFPRPLAALAKLKSSDPLFAERFEVYIGNLELADCYTELADARQQEKRFKNDLALRKKLKKSKIVADMEFIESLKKGLPDSSGVALGIDRTVMLFANAQKIQDTLFFPLEF